MWSTEKNEGATLPFGLVFRLSSLSLGFVDLRTTEVYGL